MNFLITGGSRGLGRQLVLDMIAAGHGVAFTYRSDETAAQATIAQASLVDTGRQCRSYRLDQSCCAAVDAICDQVLEDFGDIQALVNNAAVNENGLAISTTEDRWQTILQTNLSGPFYLSRALLPHFLGTRSGRSSTSRRSPCTAPAVRSATRRASRPDRVVRNLAREYGGVA